MLVCRYGLGHGPRLDRGGVTAARSQPGRVQPRARRPGPWQRLQAHRHPGVFGSHDPPPTARLGRARRRCGTAQSRARRLQPDDRPRPRRPLIGWVDHQSPRGSELSSRSPVDRGKQGTKRSVVTDGRGIPLAPVGAGANRHDSPLYEHTMRQIPDMIGPLPDQPWVGIRGYDSTPTRHLLDELGYVHEIARKPIPAPIQAGKRWVVEHTHSLDERLRQEPPLHRETPQHRRVLPAPRRHPHRNPPPHQRSPHPLPLTNPTHHPKTQVTINCRTF